MYANVGDSIMMKPAKDGAKRLLNYGITSHIPCISTEICLEGDQLLQMQKALINLTTPTHAKNMEKLAQGQLRVFNKPLALRGVPPWQDLLTGGILQNSIPRYFASLEDYGPKLTHIQQSQFSFLVKCHICKHSKDVSKCDMIFNNTWKALGCKNCKIPRKASKWLCECNLPWHTCPTHRHLGFLCRSMPATNKPKIPFSKSLPPQKALGRYNAKRKFQFKTTCITSSKRQKVAVEAGVSGRNSSSQSCSQNAPLMDVECPMPSSTASSSTDMQRIRPFPINFSALGQTLDRSQVVGSHSLLESKHLCKYFLLVREGTVKASSSECEQQTGIAETIQTHPYINRTAPATQRDRPKRCSTTSMYQNIQRDLKQVKPT